MATKTSLLGLTKPAYTDAADVNVLNTNFDLIDKAVGNGTRVQNLLDNSWFLNPVNQRGKTSQLGQGYFIDRWTSWSDDNQISLSTNGLTANLALTQGVQCDITKTYTAAVCLADGSIYAGTGIPANGDFGVWEKVWVVKTEYGVAFYLHVTNAPQTYRWAALYEGAYTADTLPAYVYKGYAAELAECQRYFERKYVNVLQKGSTTMYLMASFADKRIYPTVAAMTEMSGNVNANVEIWNIKNDSLGGLIGSVPDATAEAYWYGYLDLSADL